MDTPEKAEPDNSAAAPLAEASARSLESMMEQLRAIYEREDGSAREFEEEAPTLRVALRKVLTELGPRYSLLKPLGRGGAGIVWQLHDADIRLPRALKLPRPRQDALIESVKNEIRHLRSLHHRNLISVYAAGDVEIELAGAMTRMPYFVMDYVEGAQGIDSYLEESLTRAAGSRDLPTITSWLAQTLHSVANAIAFLHEHGTLHFDVKPGNILIASEGGPILSDLGYAKKKSEDTTSVVVGFTLFYAHPDLRLGYAHMSHQNRVRYPKAPSDFKFAWDLYAFGRTVLQLLGAIDRAFPDAVMYDRTFVYLHLMACRLLDGHNLARDESDAIQEDQARRGEVPSIYDENWLTLERRELGQIRYLSATQLVRDFEKLQDDHYYLRRLPELNPHYPHRVQVSDGVAAPFSERVKRLVEHPVFLRLRAVKQLGLADSVYPGCAHTRLEHSLGVFRLCVLYLQALENDSYNPLFRQLTDEDDLAALLVAALVHDLGQFPLAHELEDAASQQSLTGGKRLRDVFRHERLSTAWLENPTCDADGATIADIIENGTWGWGVRRDVVAKLVYSDSERQPDLLVAADLKTGLLRSIMDGPVDVDKVDYLIRDSRRAELPYGAMIDVDRLTRSLTVVLSKGDSRETFLTLGTYERGQSAGEAITFVRYQLYQALYWHHTVRAIRPMLREILRGMPRPKPRAKSFEEAFRVFLGLEGRPEHVSVDEVLAFLERLTSLEGKELVAMIRARRFYKRLLTVHSSPDYEGKEDLLNRFRAAYQREPDFDSRLQGALRSRFEQYHTGVAGPQPTVLASARRDAALEELLKPGRILCDCPSPRTGSSERLRLALEPKRRLQNYRSRIEVAERVSEVWQQVNYRLMAIASKGRVYCHPAVRDPLMSAVGPEGILHTLEALLPGPG